jgi:hypothetical protein
VFTTETQRPQRTSDTNVLLVFLQVTGSCPNRVVFVS